MRFGVLNVFYFQTDFNLRFKRKRDLRLTCKRAFDGSYIAHYSLKCLCTLHRILSLKWNSPAVSETKTETETKHTKRSQITDVCGTLKCENAAICEKVAKCEKYSTLNVKIDAICAKITLNVKKWGSLNVSNISTLNVLKSTLYVQTLFWRYLWKSNFSTCQISER